MATGHLIAPFPADIDRDAFGHWVSGFTDGEANFCLRVVQLRGKTPQPSAIFRIGLRADDAQVVYQIQSFWQCGVTFFNDNRRSNIKNAKPVIIYAVSKTADLANVVVPHFERYPLWSKKRRDYDLWKQGVGLLDQVQKRKLVYRPGHAPNRHGGTFPKWTDAERNTFQELVAAMTQARAYRT